MTDKDTAVISVRDLPRRPSSRKEIADLVVTADREWTNGVEEVDTTAPLHLQVDLQGMSEGVLVQIRGAVPTRTQCSRCARDLNGQIDLNTSEMYFDPGFKEKALAEGDQEAEDFFEISDEQVNLRPLLRDEIVLQMRQLPLCDPPCLGICPQCGQDYEQLEVGHTHEIIDPRWAALGALSAQLQASEKAEEKTEGE